jgi:thioredoxin-like negative regulator of GroEL
MWSRKVPKTVVNLFYTPETSKISPTGDYSLSHSLTHAFHVRQTACKMIKPIYEDLSKKYENVAFGKVDIDENDAAAIEYEISAVPTFILFDGENAVERFTGADPNKLEEHVKVLEQR